jgi:hypothetical protein
MGEKSIQFTRFEVTRRYEGADKFLAFKRKQQATGLKKCIYIFPPELHTLMTSLF